MQLLFGVLLGLIAMFFWNRQEMPIFKSDMSNQHEYELLGMRLDDIEKDVIKIRMCSCDEGLTK